VAKHPTKGKRLYRCDECKTARFVHWTEASRAGRLKCMACGSARMLISSDGADDAARIAAEAADRKHQAETNGTASMVPQRAT